MASKPVLSLPEKIIQVVYATLATIIGLYPILYFLQNRFGMLASKNAGLLTSMLWLPTFYVHIIAGGLALLFGWVQFSQKIRVCFPSLHRKVGRAYIIFALCSSVAAGYLSMYAVGGFVATVGFLCLAVVWCATTCAGYACIVKGKISEHKKLMIFSYAACLPQ